MTNQLTPELTEVEAKAINDFFDKDHRHTVSDAVASSKQLTRTYLKLNVLIAIARILK